MGEKKNYGSGKSGSPEGPWIHEFCFVVRVPDEKGRPLIQKKKTRPHGRKPRAKEKKEEGVPTVNWKHRIID